MMSTYSFSVPFEFPLHFTRGVFDRQNPLLKTIVTRLEPARRHRLLVVVDERVAAPIPHLHDAVLGYAAEHAASIELVAPPVIVPGGEAVKNDIAHALSLLQVDQRRRPRSPVVRRRSSAAARCSTWRRSRRRSRIAAFASCACRPRCWRRPTPASASRTASTCSARRTSSARSCRRSRSSTTRDFLDTLGRRDRIAGVAEAVKVALLKDPAFFDDIAAQRVARGERRRDAAARDRALGRAAPAAHLRQRRSVRARQRAAARLRPLGGAQARVDDAPPAAPRRGGGDRHRARRRLLGAQGLSSIARPPTASSRCSSTIGFQLWDDALDQRERDGGLTLIAGLREFREHLGGELHITLLRGIGNSFEVTEMDERLDPRSRSSDLAKLRPANAGR